MMAEAAQQENLDPERLSLLGCVQSRQTRLPEYPRGVGVSLQQWYQGRLGDVRPEVIRRVARLPLWPSFIVEAFRAGLHASPLHGFSVEFSEHRKYVPGDDLKDLDWTVYAKTEKYYVKKFQAETNLTGYLLMD